VAIKDPVMMEVVGAFVKREDSAAGRALTAKHLCEHLTRVLSHQYSPEWVWFMGEDGLDEDWPKTASGKIVRSSCFLQRIASNFVLMSDELL
jgi:acyl-CoA synthetase (AMP-forming)/AMP-acid ligase II